MLLFNSSGCKVTHLHRHHWKHLHRDPVELVEAAPGSGSAPGFVDVATRLRETDRARESTRVYGCIAGKHQSQQTEACEINAGVFCFLETSSRSCAAEIPAYKQEQQMLSRSILDGWAAFANPHSYSKHSCVCLQRWLRRDERWPDWLWESVILRPSSPPSVAAEEHCVSIMERTWGLNTDLASDVNKAGR